MSFGFSVGDFIAAGTLAVKVYGTLRESTGSSADYQSLVLLRDSLWTTLKRVENQITRSQFPAPLVNAINQHLTNCSQLLQKLDDVSEKYKQNLSLGGSGNKLKDNWRKITWGNVRGGIKMLQEGLEQNINAIVVLVSTYEAQAICRVEERTQNHGSALKTIENRTLECLHNTAAINLLLRTCDMKIDGLIESSRHIQEKGKIPQSLGYTPITFIDALGRHIVLTYELCTNWEVFQDTLKLLFKGQPGSEWVRAGSYDIFSEGNDSALVTVSNWEDVIEPGMQLSMAMLLRMQRNAFDRAAQDCPGCGTQYKGYGKCKGLERVRCTKCGTWFQISSEPRVTESPDDNITQLPDAEERTSSPTNNTVLDANELKHFRRIHVCIDQIALPKRMRRGRVAPPGRCHSCHRTETPEWRRGPDGRRTLCKACGLHYRELIRKLFKNTPLSSTVPTTRTEGYQNI